MLFALPTHGTKMSILLNSCPGRKPLLSMNPHRHCVIDMEGSKIA